MGVVPSSYLGRVDLSSNGHQEGAAAVRITIMEIKSGVCLSPSHSCMGSLLADLPLQPHRGGLLASATMFRDEELESLDKIEA